MIFQKETHVRRKWHPILQVVLDASGSKKWNVRSVVVRFVAIFLRILKAGCQSTTCHIFFVSSFFSFISGSIY